MTAAVALLTEEQVIAEVRRIAAEFPDYVYEPELPDEEVGGATCLYHATERNPHGCIIGFALRRLGVPERLLGRAGGNIGGLSFRQALHSVVDASVMNSRWLLYVQKAQDAGAFWGDAVLRADGFGGGRAVKELVKE